MTKSYPNQRIIKVKRYSEKARANFLKIANTSLELAMYNLKGNAFKFYIWLVDNKDGYELTLYPIQFWKKANISYDTYLNAFDELVKKGYLLKHKEKNNIYLFKEISDIASPLPEINNDLIESLDEEEFILEEHTNFT